MADENMNNRRAEPDEQAVELDDAELDEASGGLRMRINVKGRRKPADNSKGKKCSDCGAWYGAALTRCPLCGSKESDTIRFK